MVINVFRNCKSVKVMHFWLDQQSYIRWPIIHPNFTIGRGKRPKPVVLALVLQKVGTYD